jgi:hypothetical protein
VHTRHEHVAIEDLGKATELMLQIIENGNKLKVDESGKIVSREAA